MDQTGRRTRGAVVGVGTLVACVVATVALWWPTTGIGFLGDDLEGVARASGGSVAGSGAAPLYRPLALWSLRADRTLWDLDARGFHLTGLVLAGVAAWLVGVLALGLARRWPPAHDDPTLPWVAAVAAAGWFALWPSHAEAVAWIGGRGDLLAAVGCLACLWCWGAAEGWWRSAGEPSPGAADGPDRPDGPDAPDRPDGPGGSGGTAWRTAAALALLAALAGKESAVVWPLVVAAVAAALAVPGGGRPGDREHPARNAVLRVWPLAVAVIGWFLWRSTQLEPASGGPPPAWEGAPWGPVRRLASVAVRAAFPALGGWGLLAVGAVAALLGAGVAVLRRAGRPALRLPAALAAGAVIAALPGTGLGTSPDGSIGERLTLLPSVPVVLLCAMALVAVWSARTAWGVVAAVTVTASLVPSTATAVGRWTTAGERAARFATSLERLPRDRPVVLLVVPDEVGGAYVARNAVTAELAERRGWRSPQLVWAATSARSDGELGVSTTARADGGARGSTAAWRVRLTGPGARFTEASPRERGADTGAVVVRSLDPSTVEVGVGPSGDGVVPEVWTLADGRVVPAPSAPG